MIEGCLASGWDDPVPASHHTLWFRGHTPLFLQEKKDYSAEMRWKYGDQLDYLVGLSTYAKLPNMKLSDKDVEALHAEITDPRFATEYWKKQINLQNRRRL